MIVEIPGLKLVSEANRASHEHWRGRQRRAKDQRELVDLVLRTKPRPAVPAVVTITRLAPAALDSDNLQGAGKHVRDAVARWLGVDDRDARVVWRVAHVRSKTYGVRIVVEPWSPARPGVRVVDDGERQRVEVVAGAATLEAVARSLGKIARGAQPSTTLRVGAVDVVFVVAAGAAGGGT